jgi:hypothetical protein
VKPLFVWGNPDDGADEFVRFYSSEPEVRAYVAEHGQNRPDAPGAGIFALVPDEDVATLRALASASCLDEWEAADAYGALAAAVLAALPEVTG